VHEDHGEAARVERWPHHPRDGRSRSRLRLACCSVVRVSSSVQMQTRMAARACNLPRVPQPLVA
jgi:hypothetical protein